MTTAMPPETAESFGNDVRPENLPEGLKIYPQWVLWKARPRDGYPGKFDKIPYQPGGRRASTRDVATWSDFDTVVDAYESGGYNGIGFVLTAEDIFVGVDLDECVDPLFSLLTPEAQGIVDELDTYTEYSPSWTGIRCLLIGRVPSACKSAEIEIYNEGRFLTLTGRKLGDRDLEDRQDAIQRLWGRHKSNAAANDPTQVITADIDKGERLSESEVLALLKELKTDSALERLIGGDLSDYGDDHSAADFGLLSEILKRTDGDPVKGRQVFEMTSLAWRSKWRGRSDYRNRTLTAVLKAYQDQSIDSFEVLPDLPPASEVPAQPLTSADTDEKAFPEALIETPGLVGSIIRSMRANSHKDQPALAVASALTAVSFLSRNAYTVSPWNTPSACIS